MTLDGIANMLNRNFPKHKGINFVRYADDFIVTGYSKETLENDIKPAITAFLKEGAWNYRKRKPGSPISQKALIFLGRTCVNTPPRENSSS